MLLSSFLINTHSLKNDLNNSFVFCSLFLRKIIKSFSLGHFNLQKHLYLKLYDSAMRSFTGAITLSVRTHHPGAPDSQQLLNPRSVSESQSLIKRTHLIWCVCQMTVVSRLPDVSVRDTFSFHRSPDSYIRSRRDQRKADCQRRITSNASFPAERKFRRELWWNKKKRLRTELRNKPDKSNSHACTYKIS